MINLMPPTMKEQIRFARMNSLALRYVRVVVAVVLIIAGIFGWALYSLQQTGAAADADVATKREQIAKLTRQFLPQATESSDRLTAIAYVQATQTKFSALIDDVAKVVPQGVSIDSMTLTGDDKSPLRIGFTATTYQGALSFRNALITSPRIAAADIESISASSGGGFAAAVVVAFKPGLAK